MAETSPPRPDEIGVPTLEAPQTYRPLSLLAILALVLGVLFAVLVLVGGIIPFARDYQAGFIILLILGPIVGGLGAVVARQKEPGRVATIAALGLAGVVVLIGLGGLVAFASTSPWLLGGWAWFLLLSAVLVAMIALSRIRSSEGALAGRDLARWGLYLAASFGGFYLIYVTANSFAVSSQAAGTMERYLAQINEGNLPQAFVETLRPGSAPTTGDLESELRRAHDTPKGMSQPGEYTAFCNSPLVQRIRSGGSTRWRRKGSSSEYTQTGYVAKVTYEISNDLGRFDADLIAQAIDSGGERKWQIMHFASVISREHETTDLGAKMRQAAGDAPHPDHAGNRWLVALRNNQPTYAYLLTLPGPERLPLTRADVLSHEATAAAVGTAPRVLLSGLDRELKKLNDGRNAFLKGTLIDDSRFRADPKFRAEQIREIHDYLNGRNLSTINADPVHVPVPAFRVVDDEVEVDRPVRFIVAESGDIRGQMQQRFTIDAELVCRGTLSISSVEERYRVVKLRLIQGVKVTPSKGRGPQPAPVPTP